MKRLIIAIITVATFIVAGATTAGAEKDPSNIPPEVQTPVTPEAPRPSDPNPYMPEPAAPPHNPATTMVPDVPSHSECPGGVCPSHPSPPPTVAPPATLPPVIDMSDDGGGLSAAQINLLMSSRNNDRGMELELPSFFLPVLGGIGAAVLLIVLFVVLRRATEEKMTL